MKGIQVPQPSKHSMIKGAVLDKKQPKFIKKIDSTSLLY